MSDMMMDVHPSWVNCQRSMSLQQYKHSNSHVWVCVRGKWGCVSEARSHKFTQLGNPVLQMAALWGEWAHVTGENIIAALTSVWKSSEWECFLGVLSSWPHKTSWASSKTPLPLLSDSHIMFQQKQWTHNNDRKITHTRRHAHTPECYWIRGNWNIIFFFLWSLFKLLDDDRTFSLFQFEKFLHNVTRKYVLSTVQYLLLLMFPNL